ncbi:MAG: VOC family protein [Bryobacteraceae bacterium]|jgi:catechol 2,3-dioxygenase-like lactoylglutathione lyase family enzyme
MIHPKSNLTSRRQAIRWLGASAVGFSAIGIALAEDLPLNTTGIEHFGMTVPDPEASAKFYGRIFDGQLFQEKDPPPRFYVKLGTGYLAFGGTPTATPSIDHFCTLINNYQPQEMRKSLEAAGVALGPGPFGMATDPDGLRLQLLRVPGGLAKTIIPAFRLSEEPALFQAVSPDHVMLHVSDLDRSAEYYRKLFGAEVSRTKKPERVWFPVAKTKLGLELAPAGEKPSIHHICVRVAGFDKKSAIEKLKRAEVGNYVSEEGLLTFRDPNGMRMELKGES